MSFISFARKGLGWIVCAVVCVALLVSGAWFYDEAIQANVRQSSLEEKIFQLAIREDADSSQTVQPKDENANIYTSKSMGGGAVSFEYPKKWGTASAVVWYFQNGAFDGGKWDLAFRRTSRTEPTPLGEESPALEAYLPNTPRWLLTTNDLQKQKDAETASMISTADPFEACQAFARLSFVHSKCGQDETGAVSLDYVKAEDGRCPGRACSIVGTVWFLPIPRPVEGWYKGILIRYDIGVQEPDRVLKDSKQAAHEMEDFEKNWKPKAVADGVRMIVRSIHHDDF